MSSLNSPAQSASGDVRMRGFLTRHTVEEAFQWIDGLAVSLESERVPLVEAHRRVLATDIVAPISVPEFDRSAMDGYALRADETVGVSDYSPASLQLIGQSLPGQPFEGTVGPGQAVRIMTGAPLPPGADAVVPVEYTAEQAQQVEIKTTVAALKNVGRRGEDVREGDRLLLSSHRLRPQDIGLIASLGQAAVDVVRQPRVRIIVTGNELAAPGSARQPFQIYEANSFIVAGLVTRDGGIIESVLRLPDDESAIRQALTEPGADVLLISGGSSVGSEDFGPSLVRELGELPIHGLAMRPSSPAGMGRIGNKLVFLLPGNPVSCLCAYDFFAGRAIRRLGGLPSDWPYGSATGVLTSKISSQIGRVDYCRVRVTDSHIEPLALSGASILSSTTRANGFVIIPAMSEGCAAGTTVTAFLYA